MIYLNIQKMAALAKADIETQYSNQYFFLIGKYNNLPNISLPNIDFDICNFSNWLRFVLFQDVICCKIKDFNFFDCLFKSSWSFCTLLNKCWVFFSRLHFLLLVDFFPISLKCSSSSDIEQNSIIYIFIKRI